VQEIITDEVTAGRGDPAGRIPLCLRIAVTGHRDLCADDAALTDAVAEALATIDSRRRAGTSATPVGLAVVSALAEGADRIVAWLAMQRGASLEVVLPMPPADYLTDFKPASSQDEFDALLAQATTVTELDWTGERDRAYERAGRAIVDRSDVVLALWDGQAARGRGGTAEIVSYAQQQGVPVLRVGIEHSRLSVPSWPPALDADLPGTLGPLSDKAFEQLDRFNSGGVDPRIYDPKHLVMPGGLDVDVPPQVQQLVGYAQPYFHRAEQTARASQRLYLRLARLLYSLAGAAVVLVATQIIFLSKYPRLVWAEVVALVAAILTLGVGRLARPHDRWIAARYLAERIRSGVFLAAVGAGDTGQAPPEAARPAHPAATDHNREWADRAFREISCGTPTPPVLAAELPVLRTMLIQAWIDNQISYHRRAAARLARRQRQLTWLAAGLFGVSALAALFHSMNILVARAEPDVWGYLSIIIPAIGAALSGYGAQREYARLAERSRLMVFHLLEARRLVAEAKDLPALQQAARGTALLMQAETADWYDVVRLHDFEVPA
jgi:hypothetical protein